MKYLFCLLAFLVLSSCHSPSDAIVKTFRTVDSSLERSNRELAKEDSCSFYYLSIQAKGSHNKDEALKADAVYQATQDAIDLIQRTQTLLKEKDPAGDQTNVEAQFLVRTPLGDSIRTALAQVSFRCRDALVSANKRPELDFVLEQSMEVIPEEHWNQQFTGNLTAAAQTTLAYLKMKCRSAATLTLGDIAAHL